MQQRLRASCQEGKNDLLVLFTTCDHPWVSTCQSRQAESIPACCMAFFSASSLEAPPLTLPLPLPPLACVLRSFFLLSSACSFPPFLYTADQSVSSDSPHKSSSSHLSDPSNMGSSFCQRTSLGTRGPLLVMGRGSAIDCWLCIMTSSNSSSSCTQSLLLEDANNHQGSLHVKVTMNENAQAPSRKTSYQVIETLQKNKTDPGLHIT